MGILKNMILENIVNMRFIRQKQILQTVSDDNIVDNKDIITLLNGIKNKAIFFELNYRDISGNAINYNQVRLLDINDNKINIYIKNKLLSIKDIDISQIIYISFIDNNNSFISHKKSKEDEYNLSL